MYNYNAMNSEWENNLISFKFKVLENYTGSDIEKVITRKINCRTPDIICVKRSAQHKMKVPLAPSLEFENACYSLDINSFDYEDVKKERSIQSLEELRNRQFESFSERLLRMIDEKDLKDSDVYNKARVSRQTFSKIRSGKSIPTKKTIFALILSMGLNIDDAEDLLMSAGYAFSDNSIIDLAVYYFIENEIYDLNIAEEMLYQVFGETLISKE